MGYRVGGRPSDGQCRAGDAEHPRRTAIPGGRRRPHPRARPVTSSTSATAARSSRSRTSSISTSRAGTWPCSLPARSQQAGSARAAQAGCTVIDTAPLFRMDPDVPLIVPEVNADAISGYVKKNIIANPELLHRAARGGKRSATTRRRSWPWWRPISRFQGRQGRAWTNCSSSPATSSSAI